MQEPAKKMRTSAGSANAATGPVGFYGPPSAVAGADDGGTDAVLPQMPAHELAAVQPELAEPLLHEANPADGHEAPEPAADVAADLAAQLSAAELQELADLRADRERLRAGRAHLRGAAKIQAEQYQQLEAAFGTQAAQLQQLQLGQNMEVDMLRGQRQALQEQLDALGHECTALRAAQHLQQ